jgi:hypothetical protein
MNNKEKGNLLEKIIEQLCSNIKDIKIERNARIKGRKTNSEREVDVLIEGRQGPFEVKIIIETKNYQDPVGVEKVESLTAKLEDIGGNLGVMVCPQGFTQPAKNLAQANGIQLFEVYDPKLKNSILFIPLRYVEAEIQTFQFHFQHRAGGPFEFPQDINRQRFHIEKNTLNARQLVAYAWNIGKIPQSAGKHTAMFNAMTISDSQNPNKIQYCEVSINTKVIENYYLKLFSASFLKNIQNNKEHFNLRIDAYSKEEDMVKNGWKRFDSLKDMNEAADISNQPESVRELLMRPHYTLDISQM